MGALTAVRGAGAFMRPMPQRHFIREWRKYRGWSQDRLAEAVGVDQSKVARIERRKQGYDQQFLEDVALALNCTPADLITRDPSQPESIYSIWDQVPPERKAEAAEVIRVLTRRTGTEG